MKFIEPSHVVSGVSKQSICCMKWVSDKDIIVGGEDHAIKLVNIESDSPVISSLPTAYRVTTAIDSVDNYVLSGHPDASIHLFDLRTAAAVRHFMGHTKYVSQVKFSPATSNLFVSSCYDGTVKLWDLRSDVPLNTMN